MYKRQAIDPTVRAALSPPLPDADEGDTTVSDNPTLTSSDSSDVTIDGDTHSIRDTAVAAEGAQQMDVNMSSSDPTDPTLSSATTSATPLFPAIRSSSMSSSSGLRRPRDEATDDEEIARPLAFRHVSTVTIPNKKSLPSQERIEMHLNEDPYERNQALHDPIVYDTDEFNADELSEGMKKEIDSLRSFEVYAEVPISECSSEEIQNAYNYRWVHRRKPTEVRSRICVQGQYQQISDLDDTYASTPVVATLRLLICIALTLNYSIVLGDISVAFLHASLRDMSERVLMWPPKEFYPNRPFFGGFRKLCTASEHHLKIGNSI